ncbi:hypothetical protein F5Y15DRAFT_292720 [Xylariaceae sp. FL0016]|nr:hypothetical protein F5Y15DRAFT_292720 [Xylariaceae sp. FL0016]
MPVLACISILFLGDHSSLLSLLLSRKQTEEISGKKKKKKKNGQLQQCRSRAIKGRPHLSQKEKRIQRLLEATSPMYLLPRPAPIEDIPLVLLCLT